MRQDAQQREREYALGAMQTINKCLAGKIKEGAAGDLAAACVGQWVGGSFTAPTETNTAEKLASQLSKLEASIDKACTPVNPYYIPSIYACGGASSVAGFTTCLACESWDSTLDILAAQYSETGTFVANGPGAIQAAVNASGVGAKLLIESDLYAEQVSITNNALHQDLKLVGCGGANNDRPRIDPPAPGPAYTNGIDASGVNGLVFQSFDLGPWPENGIFATGSDGIAFRDVISDAEDISLYAVFPVTSNDVLVEGCDVRRVTDAGIYVGQSTNIVVRYNTVIENVAGMEIENSADASVHNNYASGNTGGILIFKLPGPDVQLSNGHEIFFNVSVNNNRSNIGIGTVGAIPDGTGILVLSNDDGDFHHNIIQGNDSFGFVLLDQLTLNALSGTNFFNPVSHSCAAPDPVIKCSVANQAVECPLSGTCLQEQKTTGNKVHDNLIDGTNGTNGDSTAPNSAQGAQAPIRYEVVPSEQDPPPNYNFNCFEGNGFALANSLLGAVALTTCP